MSCYYIDSALNNLLKAVSYGGTYGLTLGGDNDSASADISDCRFEGAGSAGIRMLGGEGHRIRNCLIKDVPTGICVEQGSPFRVKIIGNRIIGGLSGLVGIDLDQTANYDFIINGNYIEGFATAIKSRNWGYNIMLGNFLRGGDTGLYITNQRFCVVSSNVVSGDDYTIRHMVGDKVMYIGNVTEDTSGQYSPVTLEGVSDPIIIPQGGWPEPPCVYLATDVNQDCYVNSADFSALAQYWLLEFVPPCLYLGTDLNQDCYVNLTDLKSFVLDWMECTDPLNPDCN